MINYIDEIGTAVCLKMAGYTPEEIAAFIASGFAAIDLKTIEKNERAFFGQSEPLNLFSSEFMPRDYHPKPTNDHEIVLIDKHTGNIWTPFECEPVNAYGHVRNVGAYHELPFPVVDYGYTRYQRYPYYQIESAKELKDFRAEIDAISQRARNHVPVFFRGQVTDYAIKRDPLIKRMLFNDPSAREVSLPSNAFRNAFDYYKYESCLRATISDIDFRVTGDRASMWYVDAPFEFIDIEGHGISANNAITATMAMGQHYGVPTFGLDVSESIDIGWWFATHKHEIRDGRLHIFPFKWSDKIQAQYPVIYVLKSPHFVNLARLGYPSARPIAQKGCFLYGSWGLHGNVCVQDIIAAVRLSPEIGVHSPRVEEIYPTPKHDPMYSELLRLRAKHTGDTDFAFLEHIFEVYYND